MAWKMDEQIFHGVACVGLWFLVKFQISKTLNCILWNYSLKTGGSWLHICVITFLLLLQVGWHQVMQEHDKLSIHCDTYVIRELRHHTALNLGSAAGICVQRDIKIRLWLSTTTEGSSKKPQYNQTQSTSDMGLLSSL